MLFLSLSNDLIGCLADLVLYVCIWINITIVHGDRTEKYQHKYRLAVRNVPLICDAIRTESCT